MVLCAYCKKEMIVDGCNGYVCPICGFNIHIDCEDYCKDDCEEELYIWGNCENQFKIRSE